MSSSARSSLNPPCRYFPLAHGKYEVSAGLKPLGTDSGNGDEDRKVFLFDSEYERYRETKLRGRRERLEKYYPPVHGLSVEGQRGIARFIAEKLASESPLHFALRPVASGYEFESRLTGETFQFASDFALIGSAPEANPPYRDEIDALASLLQEDIAIWTRNPADQSEWLASIHLCYPNHWAAEDKIGRSFNTIHIPVAGFQKLAKAAPGLVEMMITKGPFVRFAWGLATDTELNHHPKNEFQGRQFDAENPELHLRIERQTLASFPQWNASLFTIRTYFLNCEKDLSPTEREALRSAILSMTPESLAYKGLTQTKAPILAWLESLQAEAVNP